MEGLKVCYLVHNFFCVRYLLGYKWNVPENQYICILACTFIYSSKYYLLWTSREHHNVVRSIPDTFLPYAIYPFFAWFINIKNIQKYFQERVDNACWCSSFKLISLKIFFIYTLFQKYSQWFSMEKKNERIYFN